MRSEITCKVCGNPFHRTHSRNTICSDKCREVSAAECYQRGLKGYGESDCKVCGRHFVKTNITEVTCSDECKKSNRRQQNREQHHRSFGVRKPNVGEKENCFRCLSGLGFGLKTIIRKIPMPLVTASRLGRALCLPRQSRRAAGLRNVIRYPGFVQRTERQSRKPEDWHFGYTEFERRMIQRRINYLLVGEFRRFASTGLTRAERKEKSWQTLVTRTRERYEADPSYKVYHRCKSMLNKCMRQTRPGMRMEPVFGCDQAGLLAHIQKQFQRGMHWNNFGEWEIDHIIPRTAFNLSDPEQVLKCNHYSNLRPMWSSDNRSKGNKWGEEERALVAANK